MGLSNSLEQEITQVVTDYWDTYFRGDLATYSRFLRNDYHNIGTTESENWTSKAEMMVYSEAVIDSKADEGELAIRSQPGKTTFIIDIKE